MRSVSHVIIQRLMQVIYFLLYHPFAWAYDLVAKIVSRGRWFDWVVFTAKYLDQTPILELGVGTGHLLKSLLNDGQTAYGLDESTQMLRQASRRLIGAGASPLLVRGKAQFLPFKANHFSRIAATFPADYIIERETISEVYRTLKPDGLLVILPGVKPAKRSGTREKILNVKEPGLVPWEAELERSLLENGFVTDWQHFTVRGKELILITAAKVRLPK